MSRKEREQDRPYSDDFVAESQQDWRTSVAACAAEDSGVLDPQLLGDFLDRLATRQPRHEWRDRDTATFSALGSRAANDGVSLRALVDLYLSAAWRAWSVLPAVGADDAGVLIETGRHVLRVCDDAVAALAEGHAEAGRALLRREESLRREFVDDLLVGTVDPARLLDRAGAYGLRLTNEHRVLLAEDATPFREAAPRFADAAAATGRLVDSEDVLVTTREGRLVLVLPALPAERLDAVVADVRGRAAIRLALGRAYSGSSGVARSYTEAADSLALAGNLRLPDVVVRAEDLLVYRVLLRDRAALGELLDTTLGPLRRARGGAEPLLATLRSYLESGGNTTATARELHLSVRAVSYRLDRIAALTGLHPGDHANWYTLHTAVLGARALGWPDSGEAADTRQ